LCLLVSDWQKQSLRTPLKIILKPQISPFQKFFTKVSNTGPFEEAAINLAGIDIFSKFNLLKITAMTEFHQEKTTNNKKQQLRLPEQERI